MKKSTYFKIIGVFDYICSFFFFFWRFYVLFFEARLGIEYTVLNVFLLLTIAFIAPALGLLFMSYGKFLKERELEAEKEQATKAEEKKEQ